MLATSFGYRAATIPAAAAPWLCPQTKTRSPFVRYRFWTSFAHRMIQSACKWLGRGM